MAGGSHWNHQGGGPLRRGFRGRGQWASDMWEGWPEQHGEGVGSKERGVARMGHVGRGFWNTRRAQSGRTSQGTRPSRGWDRMTGTREPQADLCFRRRAPQGWVAGLEREKGKRELRDWRL